MFPARMTSKPGNGKSAARALVDPLEARLSAAQRQVDQLTPSLLARAWTPSLPARSGFALSLREIRLTRSQRARLSGQLVPQDPNDEPTSILINGIKQKGYTP